VFIVLVIIWQLLLWHPAVFT